MTSPAPKTYRFSYQVFLHLPITVAEVKLILACADRHYDRVCRHAAESHGQPGKFRALLNVTQLYHDDTYAWPAAFDDLDLALKCLEVRDFIPLQAQFDHKAAHALYQRLREALHALSVETTRLSQDCTRALIGENIQPN